MCLFSFLFYTNTHTHAYLSTQLTCNLCRGNNRKRGEFPVTRHSLSLSLSVTSATGNSTQFLNSRFRKNLVNHLFGRRRFTNTMTLMTGFPVNLFLFALFLFSIFCCCCCFFVLFWCVRVLYARNSATNNCLDGCV